MTVGASILSRSSTTALAGITVGAISVLAIWHLPLPWDEDLLTLPALFIMAVWVAMTLSTVFIAAYNLQRHRRRTADERRAGRDPAGAGARAARLRRGRPGRRGRA
ncbi:MAG: hypothetical protein WDN69_23735 [Aliidongia sp.]